MEKVELKENVKELKNQVKNEIKSDFVPLKDLTKDDIKNFYFLPVRMKKTTSRNGFTRVSITVEVDKNFLNVSLKETVNYRIVPLSEDRFNEILLSLNLPIDDELGKPITEWVFKAPCRFVKGKYDNGDEYYSLEIVFKQYLYNVYFFTHSQKKIIDNLIEKNMFNYKFIDRPDKIQNVSNDEDIVLDF